MLDNSTWAWVYGWPCVMHTSLIGQHGITALTSDELEAMKRIGIAARSLIAEEVARAKEQA